MSERRFDIVFDGSVINGTDPLQVKANLKALFKLDEAAAEKLFTGDPIVIKKNIDRKTATQYQTAMNKAGAKIQIVLHGATASPKPAVKHTPPTDGASSEENSQPPISSTDQTGFSLAPSGSDLLKPEEKVPITTPDISTDHLSVDRGSGNPFLDALDQDTSSRSGLRENQPRYPEPDVANAPDLDFVSEAAIEQQIANTEAESDALIAEQSAKFNIEATVADTGDDLLSEQEKKTVCRTRCRYFTLID